MAPIAPPSELEQSDGPIALSLDQLLERLPRSRSTIYRWIAEEGFPVVRVDDNADPLFLPASIAEWLKAREMRSESRTESLRALEAARQQARRKRPAGARPAGRAAARPARPAASSRTTPPPIPGVATHERLRKARGAH
jgi:predicted DNA-binding transcriptional regulator AlpA